MKNNNIRPTGRKGNETINRMKELMNITLIKEGVDRSTEVITKVAPDGRAYGIVKENNQYYIKLSDKKDNLGYITSNLVSEDFKYIGGLMNKKSEAYHSYSEATKQLNMRFINLAENAEQKIFNILRGDNLMEGDIKETDDDGSPVSVRYSSDRKGPSTSATDVEAGTIQTGNDGNEWRTETDKNNVNHWKKITEGEDINGKKAPIDKKTSGDNVATGDNIGEDDFDKATADGTKDGDTGTHAEKHVMEGMTANEIAIDNMIHGRKASVKETTISIGKSIDELGNTDKVGDFLSNLSESEMKTLVESIKKKA